MKWKTPKRWWESDPLRVSAFHYPSCLSKALQTINLNHLLPSSTKPFLTYAHYILNPLPLIYPPRSLTPSNASVTRLCLVLPSLLWMWSLAVLKPSPRQVIWLSVVDGVCYYRSTCYALSPTRKVQRHSFTQHGTAKTKGRKQIQQTHNQLDPKVTAAFLYHLFTAFIRRHNINYRNRGLLVRIITAPTSILHDIPYNRF